MSLESFAIKYKDDLIKAKVRVQEFPPLDKIPDLTIEQAFELINFYGKGFLFNKEIEDNIRNYVETKKQITSIEKSRGDQQA